MIKEIEKTCENCKYEHEDMESTHCRHCIHNATENFKPKEKVMSEREIRDKAIDEFAEALRLQCIKDVYNDLFLSEIFEVAKQLKAGEK